MSEATSIEWTDFTVNPFRARVIADGRVGHYCEMVSPGCKNCYASRWQGRFGALPFDVRNREKVELFLDESKLQEILRRRQPTKFFVGDMTDIFYEGYPDEWLDKLFATMALAPRHTFQLLTKRPERMRAYLKAKMRLLDIERNSHGLLVEYLRLTAKGPTVLWEGDFSEHLRGVWPLKNVWLGVSIENQTTANDRIPILLETPAAVRWISAEPLLDAVDLYLWINSQNPFDGPPFLDWVVAGGESGPGAREFRLAWAHSVVDRCRAAGVPVFVKQLGSNPTVPSAAREGKIERLPMLDRKGGNMEDWPEELRIREFPKSL